MARVLTGGAVAPLGLMTEAAVVGSGVLSEGIGAVTGAGPAGAETDLEAGVGAGTPVEKLRPQASQNWPEDFGARQFGHTSSPGRADDTLAAAVPGPAVLGPAAGGGAPLMRMPQMSQ